MPNQNVIGYSNPEQRNRSKAMAFLMIGIIIGVILIVVFNKDRVPFGRSLNRQPPQLIGLVIIVAASFGLVILCVRCMVLSSDQTSLAPSSTTTYTFTTCNQLPSTTPSTWRPTYPNQPAPSSISGTLPQPTRENIGFHPYNPANSNIPLGQTNVQQQPSIPQTPPPEFELPPSYAEATRGLQVIK